MVFCNSFTNNLVISDNIVTILILIDGFLQYKVKDNIYNVMLCHNPYFNRWFSAIKFRSVGV